LARNESFVRVRVLLSSEDDRDDETITCIAYHLFQISPNGNAMIINILVQNAMADLMTSDDQALVRCSLC
jgi:hypothetical protein